MLDSGGSVDDVASPPQALRGTNERVNMTATIKAYGEWCILSGSKKDNDAIYGARIWEGQTVKSGDLVVLVNWKGHESMTVLGDKGETVKGNPQRGKIGYTKWSVVTNK